jgi:hypothetical protein
MSQMMSFADVGLRAGMSGGWNFGGVNANECNSGRGDQEADSVAHASTLRTA